VTTTTTTTTASSPARRAPRHRGAAHRTSNAVDGRTDVDVDVDVDVAASFEPWARALLPSRDLTRAPADARTSRTTSIRDDAAKVFATKAFAYVYDKGYRQMFNALGYPGREREGEIAVEVLGETHRHGRLLDVSCGPGNVTSILVDAGLWQVIACDYAEAMCERCRETCGVGVDVYRADVADLPWLPETFDAVHSSAGAHCWGEPEKGFEEIYRVLRNGGTALISTVVLLSVVNTTGTQKEYEKNRTSNTPFWDALAVQTMMVNAGFKSVELVRQEKCFVQFKARK
jgi:SAM-dependent methyltransferase